MFQKINQIVILVTIYSIELFNMLKLSLFLIPNFLVSYLFIRMCLISAYFNDFVY